MTASPGTSPDVPPVRCAVDVVTLTWNDAELLDSCLRATLASSGVDVRLFVVDNGSQPPAAVPDDVRLVLLRNDSNEGVSARNRGVAAGSAAYVAFVDSDVRVAAHTLESLVAPLDADPGIGISAAMFDGLRPEQTAGRAPRLGRKLLRVSGLSDRYRSTVGMGHGRWWDVEFSVSACWVVRRDAFAAVGGLDTSYFYGPEDVDLCLRVRQAGWRVVQVAGEGAVHPARRRYRNPMTGPGRQHALAYARHLWRHSRLRRVVGAIR